MTPATLLTVLALVATAGTNSARIDKGFADGLRVGDLGEVYYELNVGGTKRRVSVAGTSITSVEADSSLIATDPEKIFRQGFVVEFEVSNERVSPPAILAFAREQASLEGTTLDSEALQRVMPKDPETQEVVLAWLEEQRLERQAEAAELAVRTARESVSTALISAGSYRIGLSARAARYYNQQPPFDFNLSDLEIDSRPVSNAEFQAFEPVYDFSKPGTSAAGLVSYNAAKAYCGWRGARLPTEFEWEVAIQQEKVTAPPGQLEWTASWYAPYPGNTRPEAQYGETHRVLRGGLGGKYGVLDPHRRRFMEPSSSSAEVGFRCVRSLSS